jgi:hypothetical protein
LLDEREKLGKRKWRNWKGRERGFRQNVRGRYGREWMEKKGRKNMDKFW